MINTPNNKIINDYLTNVDHLCFGVALIKNDAAATLIEANPAFYNIIGYTEESFLKKHENRMVDILVDDFLNVAHQKPTTDDYDAKWDIRIRRENGEIRWIHDITHYNVNSDTFVVTYIDITDKMIAFTTDLSYDAFQAQNQIALYLSQYTSKHFIVTDIATDKVMYMSESAMKLYGYQTEDDWYGKTYLEIGFGSKENVDPVCYEPAREDRFITIEYYNKFHKIYVQVEKKIVTIPALNRKVCLSIITDITAQKQLEHKMELQKTVHECIDILFSVGATSQDAKVAYSAVLNQVKDYYNADGAYFYKFIGKTNQVERVHIEFDDNLKNLDNALPMVVRAEELEIMQSLADTQPVEIKEQLNSSSEPYMALKQYQEDYNIEKFACVSIKNVAGETVAFMGIINPKLYQDNKEMLELLCRPICMFIEYQQEQRLKQELIKLEASSKADVVKQCVENFREFTHCQEHITEVLNALCSHYDADVAATLTSDKEKNGDYTISYIGGPAVPNFEFLEHQPASAMKKWQQLFQKHKHFITDADLDNPEAKKLLKEKFGVYNFIASPIQDDQGALTGLLYVMNYKTLGRSNLLTHIVANNISAYLDKISLYAEKHLEPLTKLNDKVATQNQISEYLKDGTKGALFIIDIDHFKNLNDTLGHSVGDHAIVTLANIIKNNFRNTDVIGRVGGDEFMVFCPNLTSDDLIHKIAQRLIDSCNLEFENNGLVAKITASIGICRVDENCNTFQSLYEKADAVLYISKKEGKNQYRIYNS